MLTPILYLNNNQKLSFRGTDPQRQKPLNERTFNNSFNDIYIDEGDFRNDNGLRIWIDSGLIKRKLKKGQRDQVIKIAIDLEQKAEMYQQENTLSGDYKAKNLFVRALMHYDFALGSSNIKTMKIAVNLGKQYATMSGLSISKNYFLPKAFNIFNTVEFILDNKDLSPEEQNLRREVKEFLHDFHKDNMKVV